MGRKTNNKRKTAPCRYCRETGLCIGYVYTADGIAKRDVPCDCGRALCANPSADALSRRKTDW